MQLRPYQTNAIEQCRDAIRRGQRRMVLRAPTGAGKTVIFSTIAKRAVARGTKTLIATDRIELMRQTGGALDVVGLEPSEIRAGMRGAPPKSDIYIAMVETLNRRLRSDAYKQLLDECRLVVFDECHKQAFDKIVPHLNPKCVLIGATATPVRTGKMTQLSSIYDTIVDVTTVAELVNQGYLAAPRTYAVDVDLSNVRTVRGEYDTATMTSEFSRQRVFDGVIENYWRITPHAKTLAFSASIDQSKELCEQMRAANINARHLDSTMSKALRDEIISWYRATPDAVLCNVGILTTGFDAPETQCAILYRATKSLSLFLQMIGRASRMATGKKEFTILDFGMNVHRHGLWEQPRQWSLTHERRANVGSAPVKKCPTCEAIVAASTRECPWCGHIFAVPIEERVQAKLTELPRHEQLRAVATMGIDEMVAAARLKIAHPMWFVRQIKTVADLYKFTDAMGYSRQWVSVNRHRDAFKHLNI